jgi:hypothetical protein
LVDSSQRGFLHQSLRLFLQKHLTLIQQVEKQCQLQLSPQLSAQAELLLSEDAAEVNQRYLLYGI